MKTKQKTKGEKIFKTKKSAALRPVTKVDNPALDASIVLRSLQDAAKSDIRRISTLIIADQDGYNRAGELLKNLKNLADQADAKEKSLTQPLAKVVSGIRDLFRPFKTAISDIEMDTKGKMLTYIQSNKAKQAKLGTAFENGEIKKVRTLLKKSAALEIAPTTSQIRKVWAAICVNEILTPRRFLVPDESAIKIALKNNELVDGWKWERVEQIAI